MADHTEFEAIHSAVRDAARRFPDRVAVEAPQGTLTYAGMEAAAARFAAGLHAGGVRPGDPVPILTEDRRELVVAILGVLAVGGLFVPLDLNAPRLRLETILGDTAAGHVAVGAGGPGEDAVGAVKAVLPDVRHHEVRLDVETAAAEPPTWEPSPDDPCDIFYTSGSTGRPKGIVGRLCGIDHFVRWERGLLGVTEEWRVGQLTTPAFDAMLRDLFVPLSAGATVCVPPSGTLGDPAALLAWLDDQRVNLVHCVPSVFRGLVEAAGRDARDLDALRCVATSGEALPPGDARRWLELFDGRIRLLNLYGPTETTMTKTFHFVTEHDVARHDIPIGSPMPGVEVLVLDAKGERCPPGGLGEIHIRTPYRSLGYHRMPDATAAAFVPNPLTGDPADIVYRTGDYGRVLDGGDLEYAGRRDQQVKIGGVRLELGEIESVLREHAAIRDAAVVVTDGPDGAPLVCAYLETPDMPDERELRDVLARRLPGVMIPALLVRVAELPRTISGKVDRRALPRPAVPRAAAGGGRAPETPVERTVAGLWAETLPVREIGVDHEFFDLGGHSLQVMRMLARVQAEFGVEVPLQLFLGAPTIAFLARWIEEKVAGDDSADDLFEAGDPDLAQRTGA